MHRLGPNISLPLQYFLIQLMILFLVLPPVDGGWGDWSVWSICGSDCLKTKYRSCDSPTPSNGGKGCQGFDFISTSAKMETALQPMESGLAGLHGQPVTVTA